MREDDPPPDAWGRTRLLRLRHDDAGEWEVLEDWRDLVFPPPDGALHHGSSGATPADTVALGLDGHIVALADVGHISLPNLYAYDQEYYQFVRVRQILDEPRWQAGVWARFGPGNVVYAWDKFHGQGYLRRDGSEAISYGGDWDDLEAQVNAEHPPARAPDAAAGPPSDAALLRAIAADDVAEVRALLARGADANAGANVPGNIPGLVLHVSHARDSFALWLAVMQASPPVTEALLAAGAEVNRQPDGGMTVLHGAILNHRVAHVPLLLRFGADVNATFGGRSALALAEEHEPAIARLLRAATP
jgi:hypothetical protein